MRDGKTTTPGWPDPTEWVNRLYQRLAKRQANYEAETDTLLKRNKAAGMLGQVIHALLELPNFREDSVHMPLKDLMIFLSDLDKGRDHPWSCPGQLWRNKHHDNRKKRAEDLDSCGLCCVGSKWLQAS